MNTKRLEMGNFSFVPAHGNSMWQLPGGGTRSTDSLIELGKSLGLATSITGSDAAQTRNIWVNGKMKWRN